MKKYYLKTKALLAILLLVVCSTINAIEPNSEDETSWWERSKQAIVNMFGGSTQTTGDYRSLPTESSRQDIPQEKDALFAKMWKKVTVTLNNVLALEKEQETLPDSAWFGPDKISTQSNINELLDEAVSILSVSKTTETRQRIRVLEDEVRNMRQTISQYRQAQIGAPIRSTWKTTVADFDAKIKQQSELIERKHKTIDELKIRFAQELSDKGLSITQAQLNILLSSVVGDDLIQSSVVYDNVKQISQQLMFLTINSNEDVDISQRYYGMYTVLLKTVLHMQQQFIDNIDEKYLPKIEQIITDVQNINANTQNLLRGERDKNRRQHLKANDQAQLLTLQTAGLYQRHLIRQRSKVIIAKDKTTTDLRIAQNTYKTVRIGGELINLLRTSQKSFDLLLNIQVPDLLVFKNLQMKQEFAILTKKITE